MRDKGEGTIYQRGDGLWVGRIELPPRDGKRRRKQVTAKTKSALLVRMREAKKNLEAHGDLHTDSLTVDQWIEYWLREIVEKRKRPTTAITYRSVSKWVVGNIGTVKLANVTPQHVRRVLSVMESEGLSSGYRRSAHTVMQAAFKAAEREGRIPRNPARLIDSPSKNSPELGVLAPAESLQLIQRALSSSDPVDAEPYLWATFLLTGARRGEILGLEWDRVSDVLDLSWQLQRLKKGQPLPDGYEARHVHGQLYWTRPKSGRGWRIIPLVDPLRGILAHWKSVAPVNPWGLVFTRDTGRAGRVPFDPNWVTTMWPERLKAAGIEKDVRVHDLRHTTVDLLYEAGVPEDVIQEVVGHSAVAMTRSYKSRGDRPRLAAGMRQLSEHLGFKALE